MNNSTTPESVGFVQRIAVVYRKLVARAVGSKILQDSSLILVANIVGTVTGAITSIITARALGPTGYGLVALTLTMVGTLIRFIDIRGNEVLIRFITIERASNAPRKAVGFLYVAMSSDLALAITALAATWLFLFPLVDSYPNSDALRPLINIYMLAIPFGFLEKSISTLAIVFKQFRLRAAVQILESIATLTCIVLLISTGIEGVVWAYVIASALGFFLSLGVAVYLFLQEFGGFHAEGYWQAWRKYLPFSFFTSFLASIQTVSTRADAWVMGALSPISHVGFLDLGKSATGVTAIPSRPVSQVIFPHLNEAWAKGDTARIRYLIKRYMLFAVAVSGAAVIGLFLLADWLIALIYGPEFAPTAAVIRVLLIGTFLEIVFAWIRPMTVVVGKPQAMLFPQILSTGLRVVLLIGMIYLYGAIGAAITYDIIVVFNVLSGILLILPQAGLKVIQRTEPVPKQSGDQSET